MTEPNYISIAGRLTPEMADEIRRAWLSSHNAGTVLLLPVDATARVPRYGWAIPNRLYGAQINADGEVI